MGLLQRAYDTYRFAEKDYAGVYDKSQAEPLAPIGHSVREAKIEISIGKDGKFLAANAVPKDDLKTIIPVTEQSNERTSSTANQKPHPLSDKLSYYLDNNAILRENLAQWASSRFSHPKIQSVLKYLQGNTILSDLDKAGLIQRNKDGTIKNTKDIVRWRIVNSENGEDRCWNDRTLMAAFLKYYLDSTKAERPKNLCMIMGDEIDLPLRSNGRIIYPATAGKLKLISSNDTDNFTYLGRFQNDEEAVSAGYIPFQQANNALRWLIGNQAECIDKCYYLCWCPQGKRLPKPLHSLRKSQNSRYEPCYKPSTYQDELYRTLYGWKSEFSPNDDAVMAILDVASSNTSRLSLIYYSEWNAEDFLERLSYWDKTCCWPYKTFGIQSPNIQKIATYAFGTLRKKNDKQQIEVDDRIKKQAILHLLMCRVERANIPKDIMQRLVQKANQLQLYDDIDSVAEEAKYLRSNIISVTCAVVKKYRHDYFKEEWSMELESKKEDRSYQFGRLLAVLEKIERDTFEEKEKRETNAIRRQAAFVSRPFTTYASIMTHLKSAYYPQLKPGSRIFYDNLIGEITKQLVKFEPKLNLPLEETYLLGYYLQKDELYQKNKKTEE